MYLKKVCLVNAILQVPYLASALYFLWLGIFNVAFKEYNGPPSFGFVFSYAVFIVFHVVIIFGLFNVKKWAKWLILVDSIFGFFLILSFGIAGAFILLVHPGQLVYQVIFGISERLELSNLPMVFLAAKAVVKTFNLVFFFGDPVFSLSSRYKVAHLIWIVPSLLLVYLPVRNTYNMAKFFAETHSMKAEKIANNEFAKLTCEDIRKNNDKEAQYFIDGYKIEVSYNFSYTGVWVTDPDGKFGRAGGSKYFCRPEYSGERTN
jgi:hypothetical protein